MAKLLFSLRGVPDDEAEEVRELLTAHELDFYETSAGNWGISMPAIWLYQEDDFSRARALLDSYQEQRRLTQRQRYLELKEQGQATSIGQTIKRQPLRLLGYLAVMALIIYVSIKMVLEFGLTIRW